MSRIGLAVFPVGQRPGNVDDLSLTCVGAVSDIACLVCYVCLLEVSILDSAKTNSQVLSFKVLFLVDMNYALDYLACFKTDAKLGQHLYIDRASLEGLNLIITDSTHGWSVRI